MVLKLTLQEFKKTKYIFLLPLVLLLILHTSYMAGLSNQYERIFINGNQTLDLNLYTSSLPIMLFYLISVGLLAYMQFYFESPLHINALPLTKKQQFLPKILVALALTGSFFLADVGIYSFIITKNYFWIQDSYTLMPYSSTLIRIYWWSHICNALFRCLDILIAYCAVGFLFGVVGNKICALVFGLIFPYVPFACMLLLYNAITFVNTSRLLLLQWFLPWLASPLTKDMQNYKQVQLRLPNKELLEQFSSPMAPPQWNFLEISFGFVGKGIALTMLFLLFYHFYNHVQKVESKQWILFPFAEKIFVFCFAIFFAIFSLYLYGLFFYGDHEPSSGLFIMMTFCVGCLIGTAVVVQMNHDLPRFRGRKSEKGRV